jgi:hypothetical protein
VENRVFSMPEKERPITIDHKNFGPVMEELVYFGIGGKDAELVGILNRRIRNS